jgi:hypothetical protein
MTKTTLYVYLGTNGTIVSPVHLEDVYYTRRFNLQADEGKALTKDGKIFFDTVQIPEDELSAWREVKDPEAKNN